MQDFLRPLKGLGPRSKRTAGSMNVGKGPGCVRETPQRVNRLGSINTHTLIFEGISIDHEDQQGMSKSIDLLLQCTIKMELNRML